MEAEPAVHAEVGMLERTMHEPTQNLIRAFPDSKHMTAFAGNLFEWLCRELSPNGEPLSESRARALLLSANVLDEPTRNGFSQVVESDYGMRLALYDLLSESGLSDNEIVTSLASARSSLPADASHVDPVWLSLAVAVFAWRSDFLLDGLDPASPPDPYSPAGQVLKRAAHVIRLQVQRSATERDKLGRKLAYGGTPTLDSLSRDPALAPLPPYYRPPVPVRYPEYAPGIQVNPDESEPSQQAPARGESIQIDAEEVAGSQPAAGSLPVTQPPLRIDASQVEPAARGQSPNVVMPNATTRVNTGSTSSSRLRGRAKGPMKSTKLRVLVQEYPDGPGLYGLQVRVASSAIRNYVAGTTGKDGEFLCEVPVPLDGGSTYDIDVTWPRDFGGDVERKSITLNTDRTTFVLPFYRKMKP